MRYHDKAGVANTLETLRATKARAAELEIRQLVVATTTGHTALECARMMPEMETIVGVTMYAVDQPVVVERPYGRTQAKDPETMRLAQEAGVVFYTGVHSLMGAMGNAVRERYGGFQPVDIIADTYATISIGTKVAVECMLMAADAGLIDMGKEVIGLGGWRGGADTALVLKPAYTRNFFECRIVEFIALPRYDGD